MSADTNSLARRAALYRDGEMHPLVLRLIDDQLAVQVKALIIADEPHRAYRHQGAVQALEALRRLLTTDFGPDR